MATWDEVTAAAPELAGTARALFDARRHKTMATLRKDGSPRISGTEVSFVDGDLWLGGMYKSMKALDLRRDPRLALHSASVDPPDDPSAWEGDAKLAGHAEEITDHERKAAVSKGAGGGEPPEPYHLFRVDVTELVVTRVGDPADHLVIEVWREGEGLRRVQRR
jgi:hypothetical protein